MQAQQKQDLRSSYGRVRTISDGVGENNFVFDHGP